MAKKTEYATWISTMAKLNNKLVQDEKKRKARRDKKYVN